ncbi:MAG: hypothetical protein K8T90_15510 [Planctomycetes bacterium]|nr:hypothetical protein [Planctomycetota bacterium]
MSSISSCRPAGDLVRDLRILIWALLVAVLLHLPAHLGWTGAQVGREALYEDGPALVSNPAFETFGAEGLGDVLARAVRDPSASWGEGDGSVGRARWRPVSTALAALERWSFRSEAASGAGIVSLLLHLAVVAATFSFLGRVGAPRAAKWIAMSVVAASPAALTAAAWPAHQSMVLATALGVAGLAMAQRRGWARELGGAALIALAGLSHEMAFGFGVVLCVMRWNPERSESERADAERSGGEGRVAWIAVIVVGAAAVASAAMTVGIDADRAASLQQLVDRLFGVFHTIVSLLVPARMHFADGPWTVGRGWLIAVIPALALVFGMLRRSTPGVRRAGIAALAMLVGAAFAGARDSSAGGAPYHDGMLYMIAPVAAAAVAWALANGVARGGALRVAAVVAGAMWVTTNVCATATRSASFRTREGHVRLAELEMPDSPVVEAWSLDLALTSAQQPGADQRDRIRGLAGRAEELGRRVGGPEAARWRRDPVAAVTIASVLSRYSLALVGSGVPPGDASLEQAEVGVAAATELVPGWMRPWLALSLTRERVGALRAAMDAAQRAGAIARDDVDVISTGLRLGLALGDVRFAAIASEALLAREQASARAQARKPRADVILLFARAQTCDGSSRVPDPFGETGVRFRFEIAIAALRGLIERGELVADAKRQLYFTCLEYGDVLATLDRTALGLLAYQEAMTALPEGPDASEASEHRTWLLQRLRAEEAKAQMAVDHAMKGEGNVADALVSLAVAFARQARFKECDEIFSRLETDLGMTPILRYHRAVHLYREADPARAATELRQVTRDAPNLARAHYELARLHEESGEIEKAVESYRECRRLAVEQATGGGAEDWLLDADDRFEALERLLRDQDASR